MESRMKRERGRAPPFVGQHAIGPVSFLNPTRRLFPLTGPPAKPAAESAEPQVESEGPQLRTHTGVYHVWRSRDNRKGRHLVAVAPSHARPTGPGEPPPLRATATVKESSRGIRRMFVRYPIWDVSYDVAIIFTLGSAIWVVNGFFAWLPLQTPSAAFSNETGTAAGVAALVGATVFELGSVLLVLEAVNESRTACFGWALEVAWESAAVPRLRPTRAGCSHHHSNRRALFRRAAGDGPEGGAGGDTGSGRRWLWWPGWHELRTHYLREIGFLACLAQVVGATVFWISGFVALPPILNALSVPAQDGIFWLPQVIGGAGFIVSSWLFMLEVQENWYKPALGVLGWHIGFWNLVGAAAFTLCGALGFAAAQPHMEYALTLTSFIGSWAFLIGSVLQWYESLDKYPMSLETDLFTLSNDRRD